MSELQKFIFDGMPVRGMIVRLTDSWQEVLRHRADSGGWAPAVRDTLGQMAAASVLMNGARIGRNCIVGAGALVTEGKEFPDNSLIVGSPAKAIRTLTDDQAAGLRRAADQYVANAARHRDTVVRIDNPAGAESAGRAGKGA